MTRPGKGDVIVPAMLLALSAVPMLGGIARLASLTSSAGHADARFLVAPVPIVLHVCGSAIFSVLGAFQFSPGFRMRWPAWHRCAGKLVALCGLVTAVSGMWMAQRYAIPRNLQGPILRLARLLIGGGMATAILLAWSSIRRREVARHEAWMIRAYALGLGAGTQVLVLAPWMVLSGRTGGPTRDLLMILAWAANAAVAEWIIRTRRTRSRIDARELSLRTSRA